MEKLTNEQREARRESAQNYTRSVNERVKAQLAQLPEELGKFTEGYGRDRGAESKLGIKLREELASGKCKKPSDFAKRELSALFGTQIPESLVPSLLYEIDNVREYPYTQGWYRRSFRSPRYEDCVWKIATIFHSYTKAEHDAPYPDYITGRVSRGQLDCFYAYPRSRNEFDIAYNIDIGNAETIEYITSALSGGSPEEISYEMLRGVFMAKNRELHEQAGKLLLAAKLQEGLRQAVCETCDMGCLDAFTYMIGVITDNDLIRYSSVKRAVGTWTGLISESSKDLDRISGKTLALINSCLGSEKVRGEALASDDVMQIHMALWAEAVYDVHAAVDRMKELAVTGTHPQVLSVTYFARELLSDDLRSEVVRKLVVNHPGEADVLALALPYFFAVRPTSHLIETTGAEAVLKRTFTDRQEAEALYAALWQTMETLPKKAAVFSPCVFPWNEARLSRGDIIRTLIAIAALLGDDAKKDELCSLLSDIDVTSYSRSNEVHLLLDDPKTDTQLDTAVAELADKESYARGAAYMIVSKLELTDRHYRMIEDMLRYKASDIRENIITLLMKLDDDRLCACAGRLLSDKKEEKRTAGLDIIMQLGKSEDRKELFARCLPLVSLIKAPTTKEQILIDQLAPAQAGEEAGHAEGHGLYTVSDSYAPVIDESYLAECVRVFEKYFPASELIGSGKGEPDGRFAKVLKALDGLIEENRNREFTNNWGEKELLGAKDSTLGNFVVADRSNIIFKELWDEFYEKHIADPVLQYRIVFSLRNSHQYFNGLAGKLFGREFSEMPALAHQRQINAVFVYYSDKLRTDELRMAAYALAHKLWELAEDTEFFVPEPPTPGNGYWRPTHYYLSKRELHTTESRVNSLFDEPHIETLMCHFTHACDDKTFAHNFALSHLLAERLGTFVLAGNSDINTYYLASYKDMPAPCYIRAAYLGLISEGYMYRHFFEEEMSFGKVIRSVCEAAMELCDRERPRGRRTALCELTGVSGAGKCGELLPIMKYAYGVFTKLTDLVLDSELRRGDSPAEFTEIIGFVDRVYGADRFVQILSALGRDTLERSGGYSSPMPKRRSLCHLLGVCRPGPEDSAETLREKLKGTDITEKRLVEASLYSEEWIPIVGEYLGWEGFESACFYFMAHMNESYSDVQKARFAKYTPIPTEELAQGAFDINWFKEACETIGEKHFDMIYDAAKYITDGAKHSRARKYADAVRGRLDRAAAETGIKEKRNKDTLMALALIPITGEDDLFSRYMLITEFAKQSKQFGAQRRASENAAAEMAMRNLAENAGFSDTSRLTLRMESKLFNDIRPLTEDTQLEDISLRLAIDENGRAELVCTKGGKLLRSVPAKHRKNELVLRLTEVRKQLTEQYRRTRLMLEQAMEDRTAFTAEELSTLSRNPVIYPLIRELVFVCGKSIGLFDSMKLITADGKSKKLTAEAQLIPAHPFDLYSAGCWHEWQQLMFDRKRVQPFKQVFRELYVKTADELGTYTSLRYAGNQIQPQKTAACLKSRRWVADVEDGLQRVCYKENIIARIYALADWFSPADIEAPTLEWVDFFDRRTGRQIKIDDVPDILFSEIMRDVDLAVSVAHAGGVDPETSHSTVEMRSAIISFTLPLFGLTNVKLEGSHAFITGDLADYSVHLGSGVVHIQGGPMINLLPVHSQHRGKVFLPFLDEDPKTAQIVSEILLFAEDKEIKDPFILEQIR